MVRKLWFSIFIRVAAIFICTFLIILTANSTLLFRYFLYREKNTLISEANRVAQINLSEPDSVVSILSEIKGNHSIDVEIYSFNDTVLYTTRGDKLMSFFHSGYTEFFSPKRYPYKATSAPEISGGFVIQRGTENGEEYLYCNVPMGVNTAELSVSLSLIENSADVAGKFTLIVTSICFVLSLVWILLFARKFSKPISEMTEITSSMAQNNFDRRVPVRHNNEIGDLGNSINNMASSLKLTMGELKEANSRLLNEVENERRLDKMRKQFVANVSHELKTPIAIISGYAEGISEDISEEKRQEYCEIILDESRRMNTLVLSILQLSRYESGQIPINKTPFQLLPAISFRAERIFSDTGINLNIDIPEECFIFADEALLDQAIKSYLENAKSHTEKGGSVTVSATENNGNIRISVFNTGKQIEEEKLPLIWQSFYRGEASHKRDSERFGLGLSIVSAIAYLHGKEKGVYNTQDGVCFWIDFDLYKA